MANFVRIAVVGELKPGEGKRVHVEGQELALFNVDGEYHALDGACTHRGGPLAEGTLEGKHITCPWHGAVFAVTTGAVVSGPAVEAVAHDPVRVVGSDVEVEI